MPENSRPEGADDGTDFTIKMVKKVGAKRNIWTGALPFDVGNQGRKYAPTGMVITIDDAEARYGKGATHWDVDGSTLTLQVQGPGTPDVTASWPQVGDQIARHSFALSEMAAEAFVRMDLGIEGDTRDGLLLPAPASAEWDVTLGQSPVFDAHIALAPSPLINEKSDGVTAVVEVDVNGQTTEVGRWSLTAVSQTFQDVRVKLDAFAGKDVTIRLRSEAGSTTDHDYLFWGSPAVWSAPEGDVRRVIVIGLDTTRPDHFGFYGDPLPDVSPEFDSIANNAFVFDSAFTPAPRTRPSFRSATTGRDPLSAVGATTIGEVFQQHGFATQANVANVHLQPRFGFNKGFDRWHFQIGTNAEDQVDRALSFLRDYQTRDTYLFLHLMDPHVFYDAPGSFKEKFVLAGTPRLPAHTNRWEVYAMDARGQLTDGHKSWLKALYRGELAYTSYQLGRFFSEIDKLPGNSLVIIHSDHGEEFWEHGGYEHNHTLYNDTTKALFVVRTNQGFQGGKRIDTPVTLADIAPTLFDFAGFDAADLPPLDGKSLKPLIDGTDSGGGWTRPIGIAHLRYGQDRWGVVHQNHKYILHTKSGQEELYDLGSDPGEQIDLAVAGKSTAPFQAALGQAHNMPVGPGWRLVLNARANSAPLQFTLPAIPEAVVLVDPERIVDHRANQAWGEPATRVPGEIGEVTWETGTSTFEWAPGTQPRGGLVFVRFAEQQDPMLTKIALNEREFSPKSFKDHARWLAGADSVEFQPGVVFEPPPEEVARIRALGGAPAAAGDDRAMLEALGYIHDEPTEQGGAPDGDPDSHEEKSP
ncbi:MAG: sulfatase-like hydrolase/transferase [Rhodobacterales bacterium]|nr:sulfatase-like hydrolase/transferase [Rhodobacterales bacterium]